MLDVVSKALSPSGLTDRSVKRLLLVGALSASSFSFGSGLASEGSGSGSFGSESASERSCPLASWSSGALPAVLGSMSSKLVLLSSFCCLFCC